MNPLLALAIKGFLLAAGLLASLMPRKFELWIGPILGRFTMAILKKRAAVARENVRRCFPKASPAEQDTLLKENFGHLGLLVLELLHLFSPLPGHYRRYVTKNSRLIGFENWKKANDKAKGVIFVGSHLGNWELMAGAGALGGMPLTIVTKHLKPEWLHKKVEASRMTVGVKGAYEPRTLPLVMRALRAGESVGFIMDQYAGPPIGIPVPFFGVKVGTLAAVSVLVERTGASVVPVKAFRDETGVVNVCIEPEMDLSSVVHDNERCTAVLTAKVEGWVRQHPQQWLWTHRRFKNVVWPAELT